MARYLCFRMHRRFLGRPHSGSFPTESRLVFTKLCGRTNRKAFTATKTENFLCASHPINCSMLHREGNAAASAHGMVANTSASIK
jgi:hypothetical protein